MLSSMPKINIVKTGERLLELRKSCGFTVTDIQNVFGFSTPQAIYKWQHGSSLPTVDNLVVLSKLYGVSINELLIIE